MPSDQRRLQEVFRHIAAIKAGDYPAIVGRDNQYRIEERQWKDLAEPAKLAILQDGVDWSGVTNRDQAHILLAQIDPGRISDAQRNRLIDMAGVKDEYREMLKERAGAGIEFGKVPDRER